MTLPTTQLPAQLNRPDGKPPIWLVDKAASRKLTMRDEDQN